MRAKVIIAALTGLAAALLGAESGEHASRGRELFTKRCAGCHSLDSDKEGPRLGGVYGRGSGSVESFPYSEALKKARIIWSADTLNKWLADPDALVPGTDMSFHVENPGERKELIDYLKEGASHAESNTR